MENLQGRVALLERRLQLISEELAFARSYPPRNGLSEPADTASSESAAMQAGPQAEDGAPFPAEVHIGADSVSAFAHGFYPREYDANGVTFRWTGNGPLCELRFFIDRGADRQFRLSVGDTEDDILSPVCGFVDYAPIPLTIDTNEQGACLVGTLPKRVHTRLAVASFLLGQLAPKKASDSARADPPVWLGFKFYALDVS